MFFGANRFIFLNAKYLRNHETNAEMIFWGRLKESFPNYRFRRQHPVSNFIADFYCHKLKLVIEIDGSIHDLKEVQENDKVKQMCLESLGLQVLRFTNDDVKLRVEKCIETVRRSMSPSP